MPVKIGHYPKNRSITLSVFLKFKIECCRNKTKQCNRFIVAFTQRNFRDINLELQICCFYFVIRSINRRYFNLNM